MPKKQDETQDEFRTRMAGLLREVIEEAEEKGEPQGIFIRICPAALQSRRVQCFLRPTAVGALEIAARRLRCDLVCLAAGLVTF